MEDVKLCSLKFSSVRQLGPDWAVFVAFMFMWATIVDEVVCWREWQWRIMVQESLFVESMFVELWKLLMVERTYGTCSVI